DQNWEVETECVRELSDRFIRVIRRGVDVDKADTVLIVLGRKNLVFSKLALRCATGIGLGNENHSVLIGKLGHLVRNAGFIDKAEVANSLWRRLCLHGASSQCGRQGHPLNILHLQTTSSHVWAKLQPGQGTQVLPAVTLWSFTSGRAIFLGISTSFWIQ